jgi:hypothetical protein
MKKVSSTQSAKKSLKAMVDGDSHSYSTVKRSDAESADEPERSTKGDEEQLRKRQLCKKEVIPNWKTSLCFQCYDFVKGTIVITSGKESNK